jgi:protein TonB
VSAEADSAPELNPSGAAASSFAGVLPSNSSMAAPAAPIRTAQTPTAPRLLNAPPPVYPHIARQARIEGDVVMDAMIDASGAVTKMDIVSGPAMLHSAAKEAVRSWRYAPAILNGEPTGARLRVVVQFRLRK